MNLHHAAQCLDCTTGSTSEVHFFVDHLERSQWVGKHRVATGHRVRMWFETERPLVR